MQSRNRQKKKNHLHLVGGCASFPACQQIIRRSTTKYSKKLKRFEKGALLSIENRRLAVDDLSF